ncbi:AraC family transcriptional regulator [Saccharibacillus sp. CPCC 101409]|uniref:helix-turn-helix transcriptional regulator n=1 Tax=Saccharibacillus sp. CPCC 101409 TaxID=3058041 RepID=UPI002672A9CB|nr:AraC family transcriptional regulator [Saccharibacillus sp. CPCC 101409]MDO3409857.1 AraC family transcriptional regulator [Saccharibacillus sp. CPCC 101409]
MENEEMKIIASIERFKPHTFTFETEDSAFMSNSGLFMSHSHEYDELTLILEGQGYYSSPEQNIKVAAGDLIMIPPGLHHGFVCTVPWQGISVHFRHERLPVHSRYLLHGPEHENGRIHHAHLDPEELKWAETSLSRLELEWRSGRKDIDSYHLMRLALETTLLLFQRSLTEEAPAGGSKDQGLIQEVLKEIHARYYTGITVGELAARHFLSESNLRKKFTEAMGISPKQYIINLRLMEAKRLLQQTDKAIETISSEVGFTSSSRFYDFFVKSAGVTPLEWRLKSHS